MLLAIISFSFISAIPFKAAATENNSEEIGANVYSEEVGFSQRTTPPPTSSAYYYNSSYNPFYSARLVTQCTWYAWGRAYEIMGKRPNLSTGNAKNWFGYNRDNGIYSYSTNFYAAKPGAILCCDDGGATGHVAIVEEVAADGSPSKISEGGWYGSADYTANFNYTDGYYGAQLKFHYGKNYNGGFQGYIYIAEAPTPDNLRVGVSGSQAYMNWDWDGNAAYYNVKIWKNKVYEGDPYRIVWSVKSNNYGFALPKGTYQAYVDACNDNSGYCKMSNVITFTVGDSVVNLNVDVSGSYVGLTWNRDNNAQYYNLKIWKNYVWEGEAYETVWSIKDNSRYLALPKGTYQAFVDAVNENTGYCSMSSVVAFTVGDSGVNLNVDVSGSYVGLTWNRDNNAQYYNLKIWKNHVWEGEAYETVWSIKDNSRYLALPKGTYQAFVDAVNENTGYCSMSSVVAFTVGDSVVNLNASVSDPQVSFSWNQDSNAQYYNLKIWKDYVWEGEEYQFVWSINDTNISLNFPTGTYQAFVDAVNEKTGYCLMSSVVTFTIEQGIEPITSILGDTNLDGRINIRDVTAIQRHIAELDMFTEEQLAAADTNGDGKVDITDATYLQMYLAEYDGIVLGKQTTT